MKKLIYVVTRADIGGAQNHVYQLLSYFQNHFQCILIVGSQGYLVDKLANTQVKTYIVPELDKKSFFPALFAMVRIFREEKADLIHVHSAIAAFVGRIAAKIYPTSVVYTVHGWHFDNNHSLFWRTVGLTLERFGRFFTDHWILLTQHDKRIGLKYGVLKRQCFSVIANGLPVLDVVENRREPDGLSEGLKIIFVGRASEQKNCLDAIRIVKGCSGKVNLTMFSPHGSQTQDLKQELSMVREVVPIELIQDDFNVADKYGNFDVLLVTSLYEGMPLCVLEAMRAGLPIIATNVCGLDEVVIHGENGFLFPIGNNEQAIRYIEQLRNDMNLMETFGAKSKELFQGHYRDTNMLDCTFNVYRSLMR